jgi:uncharacterized membrane protein
MGDSDADLVDTDSLRTLLDGIYAIVLTLLVIELRLPSHVEPGELRHDLVELRWELAAFGFAFLWLVASWVSNRELYERLANVRRNHLVLLLAPVLAICLIPLATSALAKSVHDQENLSAAVQFFGGLIGLMNALELVVYYVLGRSGLLGLERGEVRPAVVRLFARYVLPYPFVLLLAGTWPWAALAIMSLDLAIALVPSLGVQRLIERRQSRPEAASA